MLTTRAGFRKTDLVPALGWDCPWVTSESRLDPGLCGRSIHSTMENQLEAAQRPRCSVALCCLNVTFRADQVPNFLEVIDRFTAVSVPVGVERFFVVYEFAGGAPRAHYTTRLRVSGPNGFALEQRTMEIAFTTERPNARVIMEMRRFVFPHFGQYRFTVDLADEEAGFLYINVTQGPVQGLFLPPNM